MVWTQIYFIGARLIYWLYLGITLIGAAVVIIYVERHLIRRVYYEIRFPEKLLIITLIYPGNMMRDYARLLPEDKSFSIEGGIYLYDDKAVLKQNDWYLTPNPEGNLIAHIGDKEYIINKYKKYYYRWHKWPRLFYKADCPYPIDMLSGIVTNIPGKDENNKAIMANYSARELTNFGQQKILQEIYADLKGTGLIIVVLVVVILILLMVGYLTLKITGVAK